MKDGLGTSAIRRLARNLAAADPEFDAAAFERRAAKGLARLELKERVAHVTDAFAEVLPDDYERALEIIVAAAKTWDRGDENDPLRGFAAWPLFHFIETRGTGHFAPSMAALRTLTPLFTAEFAIRPLIAADPKRAFAELHRWTKDPDEHVRRLVSEGTRSKLPWATRVPALSEDPARVIALLERLKDDPSEYVRRSVANNLNDIAKDHPDLVIDCCERWLVDATEDRRRLVRHAARTLIKAAHPRVWRLLGFANDPKVSATLHIDKTAVRLGQDLGLTIELRSRSSQPQRLAVDYAIHFVKASGTRKPKVFKLRELDLGARDAITLTKRHPLRKITTRTYHGGEQRLDVIINGNTVATATFDLKV